MTPPPSTAPPTTTVTTTTLKLDKKPAFLRFSPPSSSSSSSSSSLIVSTYQLDCSSSRSGSLHFIDDYRNPARLASARQIETDGGVFRFTFLDEKRLIAALTTGRIAIVSTADYSIQESPILSDTMLLDVSPSPSASPTVLASTNDGALLLIDTSRMATVSRWAAHALPWTKEPCEVWTCEMVSESVVCSGGEDTVLKVWDTRATTERPSSQIKLFEAGVTFVHSLGGQQLLTGSYDEHVRVVDMRAPKQALREVKTAGGVWHLEKAPCGWTAACMYGGWAMLDEQWEMIAKSESAGASLLYGAALSPEGTQLASCTFNDYGLTVSHLEPGAEWEGEY